MKKLIFFAIFALVALILTWPMDSSARETKWSRGTQMHAVQVLRDSTIDTLLINPDDWAFIAKLNADGMLRAGSVDSNSFDPDWLEYLRNGFVQSAESTVVGSESSQYSDSAGLVSQLPYHFKMFGQNDVISPLIPSQRWALVLDTLAGSGNGRILLYDLTGDCSYFIDSIAIANMIDDATIAVSDSSRVTGQLPYGFSILFSSSFSVGALTIDTTYGYIRVQDFGGTSAVYPESSWVGIRVDSAVDAAIAAFGGEFVRMGTGGSPQYFHIYNGEPSGELGDALIDTSADEIKVLKGSGWTLVGGSGGGGDSANYVWLDTYPGGADRYDADSLLFRTIACTTFALTIGDTLHMQDATTYIGTPTTHVKRVYVDGVFSNKTYADTIANYNSVDSIVVTAGLVADAAYQDFIGSTSDTTRRFDFYGESMTVNNSGKIYHRNAAASADSINVIVPVRTTDASRLGAFTSSYDSIYANVLFGASSIYQYAIYPQGSSYKYGTHRWNGSSLYLDGTAKLNIDDDAEIHYSTFSITSDGLIGMPTDTMFYANSALGGYGYYGLLDPNERKAMDSACNPSATNRILTELDVSMIPLVVDIPEDSVPRWIGDPRDITEYPNWGEYDPALPLKDPCLRAGTSHIVPQIAEFKWPTTDLGEDWPDTGRCYPDYSMMFTNKPDFGDPPIEEDTTWRTNIIDVAPPLLHGEYLVSQEYVDALGPITGRFKTIQAALDSIPQIRVVVDSAMSGVQTTPDTIRLSAAASGVQYYRGDRAMGTLTSIPDQFQSQGVYVQRAYGTSDKFDQVWTPIARWLNDSTFTINDTLLTNAAILDCTLIIAKLWTVTINPAMQGAMWQESGIKINSFCPVTIRGLGKKSTYLSSYSADTDYWNQSSGSTVIFYCDTTGTNELRYQGMPLTISDMSMYSSKGSGSPTAYSCLQLVGRVTLQDITIRSGSTSPSYGSICLSGLPSGKQGNSSAFLENVTVLADSDIAAIYFNGGYMSLGAFGCHFGTSGSFGHILYATADLCSTPQFEQCVFYYGGGTCAQFTSTATQQSDTLSIISCRSVGFDITAAAAYDGTYFDTLYAGGNNVYQEAQVQPPVEFREAQFLLQPGGYPK
jgi:hypothetical protein